MVKTLSARSNPNEPCSCGSGKKFKHCCGAPGAKSPDQRRRKVPTAVIVVGLLVGVAILFSIDPQRSRRGTGGTPISPATSAPAATHTHRVPQPGPAPPGQVWSEEHGHWHDAGPAETAHKVPQPEGEVPPGKVWSEEHGHWHDLPPSR